MDLVEGRLLALPARIALEHDDAARLHGLDAVGAGARQHVGGDLGDVLRLHRLTRDDQAGARGQRREPQRLERLLEDDDAGMRAGDLDLVELLPVGAVAHLVGGIGDALVGELDVVGGDLAVAVAPHHALAEFEADAGRRLLHDLAGELLLPLPFLAGHHADQALPDRAHDVVVDGAEAPARIQRLDRLFAAALQDLEAALGDHFAVGKCRCRGGAGGGREEVPARDHIESHITPPVRFVGELWT